MQCLLPKNPNAGKRPYTPEYEANEAAVAKYYAIIRGVRKVMIDVVPSQPDLPLPSINTTSGEATDRTVMQRQLEHIEAMLDLLQRVGRA